MPPDPATLQAQAYANLRVNRFMKHAPHPRQAAFLALECREALFGGAARGGKALAIDTPIPTPGGWTTMGEMQPGAVVYGMDGAPITVTRCSDVMLDHACYRVRFDDGSEIVADAEHRWLTFSASELAALSRRDPEWRARLRARRPSRVSGLRSLAFTAAVTLRNRRLPPPALAPPAGAIRTTEEIAASQREGRSQHAIPVAGAIGGPDIVLPIDPYSLGVWLGDGTTANAGITTADPEIVESLREAGFAPTKQSGDYAWGTHGLFRLLRVNGLLGNKHVPPAYLRGSRAQRLALLQGLMDTDGCSCVSGAVEFTSTKRHLADAVVELACSLGWKARVAEGRATLYGRDVGPKYRVKWTPSDVVFRLQRKAVRQRTTGVKRTTRFRYIVSVEPVPSVAVRCIKVSAEDGMFLAGRAFIPTHNTDALLMSYLQYVDVPGYSGILLRRTFPELIAAGGLIPRSKEWLTGTGASYNEGRKLWTFPSGAELRFGHCQYLKDVESHERGPAYQFIGFDEGTTFLQGMYERICGSRLSRPSTGPLSLVPLRVRVGSNPGGEGHEFIKRMFITEAAKHGRVFLRSYLKDNPSVDAASYLESLAMLDPVSQARMRDGDWDVMPGGDFFAAESFEVLDTAPACTQRVRFWDCAATTNQDNARTAGVLMGRTEAGKFPILDVDAFWLGPTERDQRILAVAHMDGRDVPIRIEHEPGGGGVHQAEDQVRMLAGFDVQIVRPLGSKPERASPLARQAKAGNVPLVSSGAWVGGFLAEACAFPKTRLKDQVDAASGAFLHLTEFGPITATSTASRPPPKPGEPAPPAPVPYTRPRITFGNSRDPRRRGSFR